MSFYRNERIPPYEFLQKLKKVDEDLYVVFDSLSMRWDILYKSPKDHEVHKIFKVCERDSEGRDVGYRELDDRTIRKLLRMDLKRRNISPQEYKHRVNDAENVRNQADEAKYNDHIDYIYKHENHTLGRMYDALRGVYRRF